MISVPVPKVQSWLNTPGGQKPNNKDPDHANGKALPKTSAAGDLVHLLPSRNCRKNTYPNRVVLAGSGQCILIVRMPVQTVDFGEMSCQILHCSAGFLQGEKLSSAWDT